MRDHPRNLCAMQLPQHAIKHNITHAQDAMMHANSMSQERGFRMRQPPSTYLEIKDKADERQSETELKV